ncbi:hypothetical protein Q31b_57980 [Novipirellula aureliae]|uniref:Uncharacterized protein n=1 Tax=Novipirellula aureliae TaxID=2527966 RepID=A0A5C6D7K0_9BACT|nr:hypothetical protein [Novipirellula aureliae]TWU32788.1 hypothetical protein Q31b_57980 [Novipirellula aureliae]
MPLSNERGKPHDGVEASARTKRESDDGGPVKTRSISLCDQFDIQLCHGSLSLGDHALTQFWLDKRTLVSRSGTRGRNFQPILDFFRRTALQIGGVQIETIETHLLANLLPHVRHDGAQKIFPDAKLRKQTKKLRGEAAAELDQLISCCREDRLTILEFHEKVRDAVGLPCFSAEEFAVYQKWSGEMFDGLQQLWVDELSEAVATVEKRWNTWNRRFGRRCKNLNQKTVLDVLSFESKAAFQQCYSAAWTAILPQLMSDEEPREISECFHGLWHLDQRIENPESGHDIHLLHGLVLGLHPAFGLLIATQTGRELIGDMVSDPTNIPAQERFFNASLVAFFHYDAARSTYNANRRNF